MRQALAKGSSAQFVTAILEVGFSQLEAGPEAINFHNKVFKKKTHFQSREGDPLAELLPMITKLRAHRSY